MFSDCCKQWDGPVTHTGGNYDLVGAILSSEVAVMSWTNYCPFIVMRKPVCQCNNVTH